MASLSHTRFPIGTCQQIFAALLITLISLTGLQAQSYKGKNITGVRVVFEGTATVDEARIKNFLSSKVGTKYSSDKVDNDISSLYESGIIDNARVGTASSGGGVALTFRVATRPVLRKLAFQGNTKFSDAKLARTTELNAGGLLGEREILKAMRSLQELYHDDGYPDVLIEHQLQVTEEAGKANAVFFINEGIRNIVKRISFEGNTVFHEDELIKKVRTKKKGILSFITNSGRINPAILDEDVENIVSHYQNNGYLQASSPGAQIRRLEKDRVEVIIPINEGVKYTVNHVSIGATTVFTAEELLPTFILRQGDAYSGKRMREDMTTIRAFYGSRGYADIRVVPDITNATATSVNIKYNIEEGSVYKVGRVNIEGNNITQDRVIRRVSPLKPGDNLNSVELDTIRNRLKSTGYFSQAEVDVSPSSQPGYRDINVLVEEQKTGNVNFGLGFSSVDSIVGFISLEQSNFDFKNWRTFRGAGQRFSLSLRAGDQTQDFTLSWSDPWFLGRQLEFGVEAYYKNFLFLSDSYDLAKVGGAVFIRKALGKNGFYRVEYRLEQNDVSLDDDVSLPTDFEALANEDVSSGIKANAVWETRDTKVNPRKGYKIDTGFKFTGGPFGGDVDAYSVYFKGSKHWNLRWDTILTLRGRVATVDTFGDTDTVPIFEREFLGGANDLRGFELNDVGPRDSGSTGDVIGGSSSGFLTGEFTFPITEKVRGATFVDAGFVSEDSWSFDGDLFVDAGFGVRLDLPFGPLALDYAFPIQTPDEEADEGAQFNFYLNYAF